MRETQVSATCHRMKRNVGAAATQSRVHALRESIERRRKPKRAHIFLTKGIADRAIDQCHHAGHALLVLATNAETDRINAR